jgi:S1-C subfamily serine protease
MTTESESGIEAAQQFLEQYSRAISAVVKRVGPSVVRVERRGEGGRRGWRWGRARVGHGSGVVIDAEQGYIVTSYHVVSGTQEARVHLADGRAVDARRIGKDPDNDLAVLQIDPTGLNLVAARMGESDKLSVGSVVIALGNPDGDQPVVTSGIVSALGRALRGPSGQLMYGLIQTSALFNPGMSGGPLVNGRGEVVGLNTASMIEAQGINLAVPSATLEKIVPDLIKHGQVQRPRLGIVGERTRLYEGLVAHHGLEQEYGVAIQEVVADSPAARAGVQAGDIVIALDGERITGMDSLAQALSRRKLGDSVTLRLIRKLDLIEVAVQLGGEAQSA